jgi:hypothetical protein
LANIRESVADNYLGQLRTDLDWIRNGLRGWELEGRIAPQSEAPFRKHHLEAVRQLWIEGQLLYFRGAGRSNKKKLEKMELGVKACTRLLLLIALVTLLIRFRFPGLEEYAWDPLIITIDFFIGAGALLHHAIHQRAYKQHIKQFRRMETIFQKARKLIDRNLENNDLHGVQQCLRKLGQEALLENGDWVLLHRERPLELPPP